MLFIRYGVEVDLCYRSITYPVLLMLLSWVTTVQILVRRQAGQVPIP